MNILVLSWRDPKHPLAGGAEQVMHEHMKGWITAGHSVTLYVSHFAGGKRNENLDGVSVIRRGYQILGVHILACLWYLFGKHEKYNLVVDQFHGIPFFTPLYVRVPKLAVLQEIAREVWLVNHMPKPLNKIFGITGYIAEPFIFLFYRKTPFIVGSSSAKNDLRNFGIPADNITIINHGVLIEKPKVIPRKEKIKTVVFLGALARDKGIEDAIKTFAILGRGKGFQFWVLGMAGKDYLDELNMLTDKLGIKRKIKFWGYVSDPEKFKLLARAHIMINPSIREGWGLVNIEANAMGVPVVAYRSPGLIDSVKDGKSGILCKQNTPESMAEETVKLLNNKNKYKRLSFGAIRWSKKFSWKKARHESLDLVTSLVA